MVGIQEISVREIAGVRPDEQQILLVEGDLSIRFLPVYKETRLTISEARKLARQLYRLARRVEVRLEGNADGSV